MYDEIMSPCGTPCLRRGLGDGGLGTLCGGIGRLGVGWTSTPPLNRIVLQVLKIYAT